MPKKSPLPPPSEATSSDDGEKPSRARLALLLLALVAVLALAARKIGPTLLYTLRHKDPVLVPREGEPVLLVVKRTHVPGSTRETRETIVVDGTPRSYVLLVPIAPTPGPLPLVLVFHGDGGSDRSFHEGFPFEMQTRNDAIVVYPDGRFATWELHKDAEENPDIHFVEAIANELAKKLPIDRSRIFGTGYSSGGFLINLMACERPGFFRAIASNAGGAPYQRAEKFPNGFTKCKGQVPIPMMALHGTQDYGVGIDSGAFSAQYWAYVNGCDTSEMETTAYEECHAYRKCPKDKAVLFCRVEGLGHWVWDRAAEATWTFFLKT